MARHRVRLHRWENGRLRITDTWFEEFEDAFSFANNLREAHSVKVFNDDGAVVHSGKPAPVDTYA